jgi:glucosamine--fructose-6-phosphate aminotransferase (isomerizing)
LADLDAVPAHIERALEFELRVQALVTDLSGCEHFSFIGAGPGYTAALLAEAKLKETSHTRAEAHQLEEFAHVHLFAMQPRDPLFFIAPSDRTSARAREIAAYAVEYGARCVAVVVEGDGAAWRDLGAEVFELPVVQEVFSPLIHVIPLQLFAYHLALAKGHNPDRPARFDNAIHQKLVYSDVLEGWHEDD